MIVLVVLIGECNLSQHGDALVYEMSNDISIIDHRALLRYLSVNPNDLEVIVKILVEFKESNEKKHIRDLFGFYYELLNPKHKGHIDTLRTISDFKVGFNDVDSLDTIIRYMGVLTRVGSGNYNLVNLKKPAKKYVDVMNQLIDRTILFNAAISDGVLVPDGGLMRYYSNYQPNIFLDTGNNQSLAYTSIEVQGLLNVYDVGHDLVEYGLNGLSDIITHRVVFNPMINKSFVWSLYADS